MISKSDTLRVRWSPIAACLLGGLALISCSAEPETDARGSCPIKCGGARIGGAEFIVEPLWDADTINLACEVSGSGYEAHNGPVAVRFQVYEKVTFGKMPGQTGGDNDGGDGGGGALDGLGLQDSYIEKVPRGGIGFEPWVTGPVAVEMTHPDLRLDSNSASSNKYAGVVTPPSEWCSDTCGVITYEFHPNCLEGASLEYKATAVVHGANSPKAYQFVLTQTGSGSTQAADDGEDDG